MNKLNGWARLGIVLSILWVGLASFIYLDELYHNPSYATKLGLHGIFDWVEDKAATEQTRKDAIALGLDLPDRYVFLKPTFGTMGFLKLVFFPVFVGWLAAYILIWTFRWVREGFRT